MHCPNCGQQQISNETKFCSRCGLPLVVVSELLVHGGSLPQLAQLDKASNSLFTRKNGIVFSLFWFIFFVPLLTSIFGGVFGIDILGAILALIGCFGALMIFIFSLVYLKKPVRYANPNLYAQTTAPAALYSQANASLPLHQSIPASAYTAPGAGTWRDTKDLEPASVTENTTRLLKEDDK